MVTVGRERFPVSIVSLTNDTDPSTLSAFTPVGCALLGGMIVFWPSPFVFDPSIQDGALGGRIVVNPIFSIWPSVHRQPTFPFTTAGSM